MKPELVAALAVIVAAVVSAIVSYLTAGNVAKTSLSADYLTKKIGALEKAKMGAPVPSLNLNFGEGNRKKNIEEIVKTVQEQKTSAFARFNEISHYLPASKCDAIKNANNELTNLVARPALQGKASVDAIKMITANANLTKLVREAIDEELRNAIRVFEKKSGSSPYSQ